MSSPLYAQLLARWFQFGAFCGVMRVHGYRIPTLPQSDCDGPVELGMGSPGGHTEVGLFLLSDPDRLNASQAPAFARVPPLRHFFH